MYIIERSDDEVDALLEQCHEAEMEGKTKYRGMTYEQCIKAAIDWLTQKEWEHPLDD